MPTDYSEPEDKPYLVTDTDDVSLVASYSGLNFSEVLQLDCYTFRKLLINAFISKMRKTQEGQEYLETCWILTQTETDTAGMRKYFGKEGKR